MKIIFATWLYDKTLGPNLRKHGASKQLLSYHFLTDQGITKKQLTRYIKTGKIKK